MTLTVQQFTNGEVIDADDVNGVTDELITALFAIGDANMDPEKPLGKNKIAARFFVQRQVIQVVPFSTGTDWSSVGNFVMPTSRTTVISRFRLSVATGEKLCLARVDVEAKGVAADAGGTKYPEVRLYKCDGMLLPTELIGGVGAVLAAADTVYSVYRANPTKNPLIYAQDGDTFAICIGGQDDTAATDARGVDVTLTWVGELIEK